MTTIVFVFAGRKPNLELQLPLLRRILDENRGVELHIWNLARDNGDSKYIQTIEGDRIAVFNEYRRHSPGYDKVYQHYTDPSYKRCVFVKLDDDVVFLQTSRFRQFVRAVRLHPEAVVSANVINNGACTPLEPELWKKFKRIGIPLLDVHKSSGYASIAHNYFFDHYPQLLDQNIELIPTKDWLSINAIGYTWEMNNEFARLTGTRCQAQAVAGRDLTWLGDEGIANMCPRLVMRGFLTAHLGFGPQNLTTTQLFPWRQRYAQIGERYLATAERETFPEPPRVADYLSFGQNQGSGDAADWRQRWSTKTDVSNLNNPLVGRFTS